MRKQLYLYAQLRESSDKYDGFGFFLPVTRVWFENVNNDLHIQFTGYEGRNICPHHNAHKGELEIPKAALKFRAWLKAEGGPTNKRLHIESCMIEIEKPTKGSSIPPEEAMKDLIDHWHSPNGPFK